MKRGLVQGRPGGGEARLSLVARHLVQQGTQRAGARTVGLAGRQKANSLRILAPPDVQLSNEAEPIV